ncbi:MAG: 4Fe-4S dicluster domain-containing protein [Desulfobacterales bacterium]|nr:4Fe-4S dicluster domain-containing protein [Desulfobacterales bacterium]
MEIDRDKCNGCGLCVRDCPLGVMAIEEQTAVIAEGCVQCCTCLKVCPRQAVIDIRTPLPGALTCDRCPVACQIPEERDGACRRFVNRGGALVRSRPLLTWADVADSLPSKPSAEIERPIITGVGAGGTYPDCVPAPYIVSDRRDGVDVVTVVTEVPLSYSGVKVKIDTDLPVGEEGAAVKYDGRPVGMVETEEYGSKILAIGGVNRLTGKAGFAAARAVAAAANREALELTVKGGARLEIQVGREPVIDGKRATRMRVGCGSAAAGLFSRLLEKAADEVIVLDAHITSLFSHHTAGRFLGKEPSGVALKYPMSTPGRYFGKHGRGWGGTDIENPIDVVASVDMTRAEPGGTLLITETTGQKAAMFRLGPGGVFEPMEMTASAREAVNAIAETCQESRVSAMYVGGAGGSARAGVVKHPLRLTRAVHAREAVLTCGGASVFLLPGGGITFYVDVEHVPPGAFTWVPTPASVAPVEYTMRLDDYQAMGGHIEAVRPFSTLKPKPYEPFERNSKPTP